MPLQSNIAQVLGLLAAAALVSGRAGAEPRQIDTAAYKIIYENVTEKQVRDFAAQLQKGLDFMAEEIGRRPSRKLTIIINDDIKIRPRESLERLSISLPASRIRGDFRRGPSFLHGRGPAIVSSLAEVLILRQNARWGKFLSEGIGVHYQDKFERKVGLPGNSYPNMGRPLHAETARVIQRQRRVIRFSTILDLQNRDLIGTIRRQSLLQKGSFVRFLIVKYGKKKLFLVVDGATFQQVYGLEACKLEREWLEFLIKNYPQITSFAQKRGNPCRLA